MLVCHVCAHVALCALACMHVIRSDACIVMLTYIL